MSIGAPVRQRPLATDMPPFSGPVAVAGSTLAATALFSPLRRRVQRTVHRRFNRAGYDSEQTVAAFAARLNDAVDLDAIRDDLAAVVRQALEPATRQSGSADPTKTGSADVAAVGHTEPH
jgi:hypothetical protein